MFSIFKSRVKSDLSFIGVDMHSHLLPGLDDGLKSAEDTIAFVEKLHKLGYDKLICTPHIISDLYPNNPENINAALQLVRDALAKKNIPVKVEAAAEYMVDAEMQKYVEEQKPLLTFNKDFILIEMSYIAESRNIDSVIFNLKMRGLQPILAHPERYNYYHSQFEKYQQFIDRGCMLQVNLLSLLGYYGKPVKAIAEKLIKSNMVTLLGTDMHHENHLAALHELASQKDFYKLVENAGIKNKELLS